MVFAAEKANPLKVERMRALGAEVRLVGHDFDAAKEAVKQAVDMTVAKLKMGDKKQKLPPKKKPATAAKP